MTVLTKPEVETWIETDLKFDSMHSDTELRCCWCHDRLREGDRIMFLAVRSAEGFYSFTGHAHPCVKEYDKERRGG